MYFEVGQIDRAIYNEIRKELIANGHIPDAEGMTEQEYFTARAAIALNGTVIEVFPVGNFDERDYWRQNTIVVDREDTPNGEFGGVVTSYRETTPTGGPLPDGTGLTLQKIESPPISKEVNYTIRYITQDQSVDEVMARIIESALPTRKPIKGLNLDMTETEYPFRIQQVGNIDVSGAGFIEKGFRYNVKNVYLRPAKVVEELPKMTDFRVITEPKK